MRVAPKLGVWRALNVAQKLGVWRVGRRLEETYYWLGCGCFGGGRSWCCFRRCGSVGACCLLLLSSLVLVVLVSLLFILVAVVVAVVVVVFSPLKTGEKGAQGGSLVSRLNALYTVFPRGMNRSPMFHQPKSERTKKSKSSAESANLSGRSFFTPAEHRQNIGKRHPLPTCVTPVRSRSYLS